MPPIRTLALALGFSLTALLAASDADAARKKSRRAPAVPPACSDFYDYANAAWLKAHPVPPAGAITALGELSTNVLQQQRDLLDASMSSPQNKVQKLLGDFWASGMDEAAVEKQGSAPIAPLLSRIDSIKKSKDIAASIAALHQVGIPVAFDFGADVDLKALGTHMGYFLQGGMGLPDPSFYTRTDADTVKLMGRYRDYIKQILTLTGTPANLLDADVQSVLQIEIALARASKPVAAVNNPFNNYAPVSAKQIGKTYKNLRLDDFLEAQGVKEETVSLSNPEFFKQLNSMIVSLKPEQWKAYLRWRVGDSMAPYLSKSFRDAEFAFRGRLLRGQAVPPPRWQQVLDAINVAAGPMLGREYAARYMSPETRRQAVAIIDQIRNAQIAAIDRTGWGNAEVVAEAKTKLAAMQIEVGTPSRDLDYTIQPMGRGSFGSNMLIASTWRHHEEMRRIGETNADRRWNVLPQQPALAYDIAQNRLIVTAAVLQPPVYTPGADPAVEYGAFGSLVAHELTRAIDAKGALVDAKGQLRSWWSPAEKTGWTLLTNKVVEQYAAYPYPGVANAKVNGQLTAEENLADQAGVELAWQAFTTTQPDASDKDKQAFFSAWAQLWAQQVAPNEAAQRATADVHAPGQWRANGPLSNMPAFGAAFSCKPGQPMQRPEAEQLQIWR